MQGKQFHISLLDSVKPFCVNTPRGIPFAYSDKLKAELNLLEEQQIIAPITAATEWCAPIVVTPKKNTDRIRMCVDLSHLNRYVHRERYQSCTSAQAVADIDSHTRKVLYCVGHFEGLPPVPLRSRKSTPHHFHHAFWQIQVPPCPIRYLLYIRTL